MDKTYAAAAHHLGGETSDKPKKEIAHIKHEKSHNGDHIFTHRHTHPEHHPDEVHTKRGDDEMVAHMLEHAGTPNPGEGQDASAAPEGDAAAAAPAAGAASAPMASPVQGAM